TKCSSGSFWRGPSSGTGCTGGGKSCAARGWCPLPDATDPSAESRPDAYPVDERNGVAVLDRRRRERRASMGTIDSCDGKRIDGILVRARGSATPELADGRGREQVLGRHAGGRRRSDGHQARELL